MSKFFGVSCRVLGWLLNQPQRHLFFNQKCLHRLQRPSSLCLWSVCLYVLKFCGKPECTCATKIKSYRDLTKKYQDSQTKVLCNYLLTSNLAFYWKNLGFLCCAIKNLALVTLWIDLFWFLVIRQLVLCSEVTDRNLCQSSLQLMQTAINTGPVELVLPEGSLVPQILALIVRRGFSTLKGGNSRVYPYPSKGKGRVGFKIFPKGIEG